MRRILVLTIFAACSLLAWGQTSIEYGTLSSGTAIGASKTGGTAGNALGKVGKRLGNAVSPSSPSSPAQQTPNSTDKSMRSNREVLDKQAQQSGCGMLHISSVPKHATLLVDHLAVAATPADLCLPLGKHMLELRSAGFKAWSQEVTITREEAVSLAPKLTAEKQNKDYKRTVNLSF